MTDSVKTGWQDAEPAMVELDRLAPHPVNVRTTLTDLDELAESIVKQGLTSPLEVMPAQRVAAVWPQHAKELTEYAYVLLSGHRRLAAARRVYAEQPNKPVPVLIRRDEICDDPARQVDSMITEAVASRSLTPIEQARAFESARVAGYSQKEIAERYGCTQPHVSQQLTLLHLPEGIRQAVERRELPVRDALKLARLDGQEAMRGAWALYLDRREDAWITSVEQAIAEYADRAAYQARREAALAQAEAVGVQVVDPVEEFGRHLAAHRLTDPEPVAAAREAGTLVAGISGDGELEYYTTKPAPGPKAAAPDSDQRRAAAATRERAGRLLAAQRPADLSAAAEPVVDAFLRSAPDGWRPIARRWLRWLQLGPDAGGDPAGWWEQIYAADWETRAWAAHCLALAACEHRARTSPDWDQADRAWLWRLITDAGYVPRPWERQRLGEGHDDPTPETELPAAAPDGWFEPHEQCPAVTWLNGTDLAWLERDPKRFHEAEQLQQCHLEAGHPGRHAAHVQDAGADHYHDDYQNHTGVLALWAWWRDPPQSGHREECRLAPAEPCPATGPDQEPCLLFAGHPRRHS